MSQQIQVVEGMYGGWKKPSQSGIAGLSMRATLALGAAAVFLIILIGTAGLLTALEFGLPLALVVGVISLKDQDGMSLAGKIGERIAFAQAKSSGATVYRAGPASKATGGRFRLPGLAAPLTVSEHTDHYRRDFALVWCPFQRTASVVLGCEPGGLDMADSDEVDAQVAGWAGALTQFGADPDIAAVSVTVETAPDPGRRLQEAMASSADPQAHPFARAVLDDTVAAQQGRSIQVSTFVTITWSTAPLRRRARDEAAMGEMVATRMPGLIRSLEVSGAGQVWPLSASQLAEVVRVAYDPAAAVLFDEARAQGYEPPQTWDDAGPTVAVAEFAGYRHDSAWSKTWAMSRAPEGLVANTSLRALMAPHRDITRKRVTIFFRPIDPGRAANLVDKDMKAAQAAQRNKRGPEVRESIAFAQARQTAAEQAAGAGLTQFGMLVTATTDDLGAKDQIDAAVSTLGASARIRLRPMYGMQDAAFAACLPLGLMLERHQVMPKGL